MRRRPAQRLGNMQTKTIIAAAAFAAALAAAVFFFATGGDDAAPQERIPSSQASAAGRESSATSLPAPAKRAAKTPRSAKSAARRARQSADSDFLDDLLDSLDDLLQETPQTDAERREDAVRELGMLGAEALPELTPYLGDEDESVRSAAMDEWNAALSEIEDDAQRIAAAELAMRAIADEDALETISTHYIGIDEKLAVESLARIIEAAPESKGAAKARETYSFVTGEEWTDAAAAEKWLAEEYGKDKEGLQ